MVYLRLTLYILLELYTLKYHGNRKIKSLSWSLAIKLCLVFVTEIELSV